MRLRPASILLEGALGTRTEVADVPGTSEDHDKFTPANSLPSFTIEKIVGETAPERAFLRYQGAMVNTLNISVPSAALATFNAGMVALGETKETTMHVSEPIAYPSESDDLLLFHGGRVRNADTGTTLTSTHDDETFQSFEWVINNNVQSDEYTIRPSRFLRSLTEGIRSIEANLTIVFEDEAAYEKYCYGATGRTAPGYNLYLGAIELTLANWQIDPADSVEDETPTGAPAEPQGLEFAVPKLAFTGLPVSLQTGRIAVTTTARALKPPTEDIMTVLALPWRAGIDYA